MSDFVLEARAVTKRFGGLTAVRGVELLIERAEIASLIGPNGAGKTTFFNCITGYYALDEGDILFNGRSIKGLRGDQITARGIARTYQNIRLFGGMTALENILVGMHPRLKTSLVESVLNLPSSRREEHRALDRAMELLEYVGLIDVSDTQSQNLSYGLQRRLEIARALASDPQLLLLDEPTAGMNPQETDDMMVFIRRLRGELNLTILLIEHDMKLVMNVSDLVHVMDHGQKLAVGTPTEIQSNPKVIEAYLGSSEGSDQDDAPETEQVDAEL